LDVRESDKKVQTILAQEFSNFMAKQQFLESISGHLPADSMSQARVPNIIATIMKIIG